MQTKTLPKTRLTAIALLALSALTAQAEPSPALFVHPASGGSAQNTRLDNVQRITFSGSNLLLKTSNNGETVYALSDVDKIVFGTNDEIITNISAATADINVYVNSTGDIVVESPLDVKSLTLLNLNGKILPKTTNISALPAGIYLIQIDSSAGKFTKKIIKH